MEKFLGVLLVLTVNYGLVQCTQFSLHGVGDGFVDPQSAQLLAVSTAQSSAELYFAQKLDHLNPDETTTWQQVGGPAFLWINGESAASSKWISNAAWLTYAEDVGAMGFSLEHRYYGMSRPMPDVGTDNLKYLSAEQAIADIANFIQGMNKEHNLPNGTKWFLFGGSYAAVLAAWARMRYPDVIYGVVASSAPLLSKADLKEYYHSIRETLTSHNQKCSKTIELAVQEMQEDVKTEEGRQKLSQAFLLCNTLENTTENISNFFAVIASTVSVIIQYNKDNKDSPTRTITIDTICEILIKENVSPTTLLAEVTNVITKAYNYACLNPRYQDLIDNYKQIDYEGAARTDRQWFYQTCTQFGNYATSSEPTDFFGANFPLDFFIKECQDVFGPTYDRKFVEDAVARANKDFGGLDYNVDRTIFVHGSIDPWSKMGITKAHPDKKYNVILIKGGAHCSDVYPTSESDSKELKEARTQILELLRAWIAVQ